MAYQFSLAYLTAMDVSPPEAVQVAAECGYTHVGFRLLPSAGSEQFPLLRDTRLLRETQAAMRDTGIRLADIEIIRIGEAFDVQACEPFLQRGADLGAMNILVAGDDPERQRLTDNYQRFCEMAARFSMTADLEFMPWTAVSALKDAIDVVAASDQSNAGILVDALHFDRSDSTLDELVGLNPSWFHYAQLCDAPGVYDRSVAGLIHTAREERLDPGDGDIDLTGLLRVLPSDVMLSLEIPSVSRARVLSVRERASSALAKARALIAGL